jgi:hypothetical protein
MHSFLSISLVLILFSLSQHAFADKDKKENKARQIPRLFNTLLPDLKEITALTQDNHLSNKQLSKEQRYKFLRNMVISINPFMDFKKVKPVNTVKPKSKSFPVKKMMQGEILYFKIDAFTTENIKSFMETTGNIPDIRKSLSGIIIDLRDCSGFGNKNMHKVFLRIKTIKLTTIALTGKKTIGAAELLAQSIADSPKGILMGDSTSGQPFDYKSIKLKSGFILLIPKIPSFLTKLPQKPVKATIYCKGKNACLNAATDLLSVVKKIQ